MTKTFYGGRGKIVRHCVCENKTALNQLFSQEEVLLSYHIHFDHFEVDNSINLKYPPSKHSPDIQCRCPPPFFSKKKYQWYIPVLKNISDAPYYLHFDLFRFWFCMLFTVVRRWFDDSYRCNVDYWFRTTFLVKYDPFKSKWSANLSLKSKFWLKVR